MPDAYPVDLPTTVALALAFLLFIYNLTRSKNGALPPGPQRWPLVGNALQLPQVKPWLTFTEWAKKYGGITCVDVFGKPMMIINSIAAAKEILDKGSLVSSDRPHLVMASELIGFGDTFVLMMYNDDWRQQRKIVAQEFTPAIVPKYHGMQEKQARLLVQNLAKDPSIFIPELKLRIGLLIIRVTYGYHVTSAEDHILQMCLKVMEHFVYASTPGNFLVDFFPILKYVPSWFPGAGFKKYAADCREDRLRATWEPFWWSKKSLENGKVLLPNICSTFISESGGVLSDDVEKRLAIATAVVLGGGLDTNVATALVFFLLMLQHPKVQHKARAEIDAVVGLNRLPKISDRSSLPYVRSLFTEVLRLYPVAPLGIPHALSEDITYEGYHLPKGSVLIPNTWNMLHDPEIYEKPMEFIPERYNNSDAEMKRVTDLVFGFGRRVCPGSSFAEGTLYAIILTVLATCEILPPLDKNGEPFIPDVPFSSGTVSCPAPFEIRLKYRSQNAMDLLAEIPTHAE